MSLCVQCIYRLQIWSLGWCHFVYTCSLHRCISRNPTVILVNSLLVSPLYHVICHISSDLCTLAEVQIGANIHRHNHKVQCLGGEFVQEWRVLTLHQKKISYQSWVYSSLLFAFTWLTFFELMLVLFFFICFEIGRPTGEKLHTIFSCLGRTLNGGF